MNNKKGFTLVELIVSFALITAVSLAFFKTILVLQQEQIKNIAKNSYKAFTVVLNNSIQKDFLNDNIEKIISCGENCYDITYTKNGIIRLSIDKENNTITYGNIKEKLPKDYKFINNIEFTSYINSLEGNDSYLALNINIKSAYEKDIENIKYVYQYDSNNGIIELDIDGAESSEVIEYLLYTASEENGLYETFLPNGTSTGIRYKGKNPNNYVYFNCKDKDSNDIEYGETNYGYKESCEVWRIIGVFEVDNGKGNVEKRVKLVNNKSLLSVSWDSNSNPARFGINQWGESEYQDGSSYEGSDIMRMLNTYYLGTTTECRYCNNPSQQICQNDCASNFSKLSNTSINMIDNAVWNTAGFTKESMSLSDVYIKERPNSIGNNGEGTGCQSILCSDNVKRTIKWTGKVGLVYPSDYGYSNSFLCTDIFSGACQMENWMNYFEWSWTISVDTTQNGIYTIWNGVDSGMASHAARAVYPSLYLKPNVTFIGEGIGTKDSPYILGINE